MKSFQIQLESLALFPGLPHNYVFDIISQKQKANKNGGEVAIAYLPLKFNDVCYVTIHNGLAVT